MSCTVSETVNVERSRDFLVGPGTVLPVDPHPGLIVGALVVKRVLVNQGGESNEIHVEYEDIDDGHAEILERKGWTREVVNDLE